MPKNASSKRSCSMRSRARGCTLSAARSSVNAMPTLRNTRPRTVTSSAVTSISACFASPSMTAISAATDGDSLGHRDRRLAIRAFMDDHGIAIARRPDPVGDRANVRPTVTRRRRAAHPRLPRCDQTTCADDHSRDGRSQQVADRFTASGAAPSARASSSVVTAANPRPIGVRPARGSTNRADVASISVPDDEIRHPHRGDIVCGRPLVCSSRSCIRSNRTSSSGRAP